MAAVETTFMATTLPKPRSLSRTAACFAGQRTAAGRHVPTPRPVVFAFTAVLNEHFVVFIENADVHHRVQLSGLYRVTAAEHFPCGNAVCIQQIPVFFIAHFSQ